MKHFSITFRGFVYLFAYFNPFSLEFFKHDRDFEVFMFQYYAPAQFLQAVPTPGGTGAGFSQPGSSQGSQLFADNSTPNNKNFMRDSRFNRQRLVLLRNWVFVTSSNFILPISLKPDDKPMIFLTQVFDLTQGIEISKLDTTLGCKDKRIRKSEFMTKTRLPFPYN